MSIPTDLSPWHIFISHTWKTFAADTSFSEFLFRLKLPLIIALLIKQFMLLVSAQVTSLTHFFNGPSVRIYYT